MKPPATIAIIGAPKTCALHAAYLFYQQGFKTVLISNQQLPIIPWTQAVAVDYGDMAAMQKVCSDFQFDAIIHADLACPDNQENSTWYTTHLANTIALIECVQKAQIKKFIFISNASIYGPNAACLDSTRNYHPIHAAGKVFEMIEYMVRDLSEKHELQSVCLRLFEQTGCCATANNNLQQLLLAQELQQPFFCADTEYQTPDGTPIFDFVHATDVARAILQAYYFLDRNTGSEWFDIGTGRGTSIRTVAQLAQQLFGKKITLVPRSLQNESVAAAIAHPSKTIDLLHWQPQYCDITTLLKLEYQNIQHLRKHFFHASLELRRIGDL